MVPIWGVMVTLKSTVQDDTHDTQRSGRMKYGTADKKKKSLAHLSPSHKITIKHWYFIVAGLCRFLL